MGGGAVSAPRHCWGHPVWASQVVALGVWQGSGLWEGGSRANHVWAMIGENWALVSRGDGSVLRWEEPRP